MGGRQVAGGLQWNETRGSGTEASSRRDTANETVVREVHRHDGLTACSTVSDENEVL